jgi:O-methyltransferase
MTSKMKRARPLLQRRTQEQAGTWKERHDFAPLLEKVGPFTMTPVESLVELAHMVRAVLTFDIPGDFVECGVWRGGASFLMADLLRQAQVRNRKVWLFDSFEGSPPPQEMDGPAAIDYAQDTDSSWYFDNCRASLRQVQRTAKQLGLTPYTEFVKGWFDQTLPAHRERIGPIAVLRIDGNWYASVRCCLDNLYDQVVSGGFVILHTYYTYDGEVIAAHEFLGERRLAYPIESVVGHCEGPEYNQSALFRKGGPTWKATRWHYLAATDIAALIPPEDTVILVDEGTFEKQVTARRHTLPFLERDGQYWGKPKDEATAIREVERMRQAGANFIIFSWAAFWWLDYYTDFRRHLCSEYRCVLHNERMAVFDLRPVRRRTTANGRSVPTR